MPVSMPMQMQLINGIGISSGHWTGTIDSYIEEKHPGPHGEGCLA